MEEKILKVLQEVAQERRGKAVPQEEEARRIVKAIKSKPKTKKKKK